MDPELADAIIAPGDSALVRYGYEKGNHDIFHAARLLKYTLDWESEADYRKSLERVRGPIDHIYEVLGTEFHMTGLTERWRLRTALPFPRAATFDSLLKQVRELRLTPLDKDARWKRATTLLSQVERIDPLCDAAIELDIQMAQVMDEDSLYARELGFYRRGLARCRKRGPTPDLPVLLMHVGYVLGKISDSDSTWIYYEEARDLARSMRWENSAVRAARLMSGWQRARGHLARAHELAMESQEAAREYRGSSDAWYGLRTALDIDLDLGAWNIVAELVARGKAINRRWPPVISEHQHDTRAEDVPWFEARLAIARGNVTRGDSLFREIEEPVRRRPGREQYALLLLDWGKALLEAGRPAQALPRLREGCSYSLEKNLPREEIELTSLYAQALMSCGRFESADSALAAFRHEASPRPPENAEAWVRHDRASIALALARRDTLVARRTAGTALNRIRSIAGHLEATETAYLFLDSSQGLREEIHRVLADDPEAGYGFELFWRSLAARLGDGLEGSSPAAEPAFATDGSAPAQLARRGRRFLEKLRARNARHLLYMVGADHTVLWSTDGKNVRRIVLSGSSGDLRRQTRAVVNALAAQPDPEAPFQDSRLPRMLAELAGRLLPPGELREAPFRRLYVSPDRFLGGLPFEALNVSVGGKYEPLLARRDVVYLRYDGTTRHPPRTGEPGIIVADPAGSPELRRRYPILGDLPNTREEAEAVHAVSPNSMLLEGPAATKAALTRGWERASFLYLASHFVRDAEIPYLLYLPLAPADPARGDGDVFLDVTEIRTADLSRCGLVVLSGCATGKPYSDLDRWGPSLGDAFLDAGAHAVIQTFWPVEDLQARRAMSRWTAQWEAGRTPTQSLCTARRVCLERDDAQGNPHFWAAYSIELGGL